MVHAIKTQDSRLEPNNFSLQSFGRHAISPLAPFQNLSPTIRGMGLPATIRVIFISGFLLFLAITYGRGHFYRDPGSIFFDLGRAFERYYSLVREFEASDWKNDVHHILKGHAPQSSQGGHPTTILKKGEEPKICTVFLTVHREGGPQYVDVGSDSCTNGIM
jgi:hypothetical protein